jgi:hypothetical protein
MLTKNLKIKQTVELETSKVQTVKMKNYKVRPSNN